MPDDASINAAPIKQYYHQANLRRRIYFCAITRIMRFLAGPLDMLIFAKACNARRRAFRSCFSMTR